MMEELIYIAGMGAIFVAVMVWHQWAIKKDYEQFKKLNEEIIELQIMINKIKIDTLTKKEPEA